MVKKLTTDMSLTGNGLRDWLVQRFFSLIIAIYFLVLLGFFILHPQLNYSTFQHFFASTWIQVFTLITLLSLFLHAWVGIWTVITDYVNPIAIRLTIQALVILTLLIYFFWGVEILWKLA
ncbi:MAG: succinate dehydrogenase, hydrophobic membrane anchor protein [Proteobacteria bacterium]|nr:succinate dehydrogenase, hydrophobic membrane anchor protein [Pseudomonadota bacterium]